MPAARRGWLRYSPWVTKRVIPAAARGPSSHSYPSGNWRTRTSANGREGSAAKCRSSAAVQPSQNSESPGPSRRRPRSQDRPRPTPSSTARPAEDALSGGRNRRPRPAPRARAPASWADRSAGPSSRTGHSGRTPRVRAAGAPARAAGPSSRRADRGWRDRPGAVRARHRGPPRAGPRRCSCPSPRARRSRSAAPARRRGQGAQGCRMAGQVVHASSVRAGLRTARGNRRSRQWTRPILMVRHRTNHWQNPAGTRDSWRTDRYRSPTTAHDRGSRP